MVNYDKTFCCYSSECANKECYRYLNKDNVEELSNRLVWYSGFRDTEQCEGFKEKISE